MAYAASTDLWYHLVWLQPSAVPQTREFQTMPSACTTQRLAGSLLSESHLIDTSLFLCLSWEGAAFEVELPRLCSGQTIRLTRYFSCVGDLAVSGSKCSISAHLPAWKCTVHLSALQRKTIWLTCWKGGTAKMKNTKKAFWKDTSNMTQNANTRMLSHIVLPYLKYHLSLQVYLCCLSLADTCSQLSS